jgi:hypothetical protein
MTVVGISHDALFQVLYRVFPFRQKFQIVYSHFQSDLNDWTNTSEGGKNHKFSFVLLP